MRLLYLLGTFPKISSEACILNEIVEMKKKGHKITILAGDMESGKYNEDVLEYGLLDDTIHFRNYGILRWKVFSGSQDRFTLKIRRWTLGSMKMMDFGLKCTFDLGRRPVETSGSIRLLMRTHQRIFSISDTYLGYRKIKERPDLVHVQFPHLNHLNQAKFLSERYGCPFTLTFRALDLHERLGKKVMKNKRRVVMDAKKIVTISEFNKKTVQELYGRGSEVVHSAINVDKFKPLINGPEKHKVPTIVFVGRFVEKKGLEHLLRAGKLLKERGKDFHLLLIGEGPLKKDLERMRDQLGITKSTTIDGVVPQEELIDELHRSHIFVMPSVVMESGDRDILPNSLKEAMAMELPVVTSNISGIEELVEDRVSGILVKPADAEGITGALEELLSDLELGKRMGREGRKKVVRDFNIEIEAGKMEDVFKDAVGHP